MRNSFLIVCFIMIMTFGLSACGSEPTDRNISNDNEISTSKIMSDVGEEDFLDSESISVADELAVYKTEGIQPLYDNSIKILEMGARYTTMLDQPKKAYNYLKDEVIPLIDETKIMAVDLQNSLTNKEIKDLNKIFIYQIDLTLESFSKTAEMTKLNIPPVSEKDTGETEKIFAKTREIQAEIDRTIQEYNSEMDELSKKYDVVDNDIEIIDDPNELIE
ncbi:hypothetical protein [Oceanobacillus senegalensis]|uniref:hypothetical protein n=1 Tax=Oceanobacillus senegalensis TaxID=1936063 RepID=UPI000A3043E0|nr:hypothetical protein [Oceanobacillus senegalensis]